MYGTFINVSLYTMVVDLVIINVHFVFIPIFIDELLQTKTKPNKQKQNEILPQKTSATSSSVTFTYIKRLSHRSE